MGTVVPGFPFLKLDSRECDHPLRPVIKQTEPQAFPGDEMTFASFLQFNTSTFPNGSNLAFTQIKQSIIAGTDVSSGWSSGFSSGFTGYREFELDSFLLPLTSFPKFTDGRENINFLQNRNWNLPGGDFARTIDYSTVKDALGGGKYNIIYNFLFPILFRWEYWKQLAAADDVFYDPAVPLEFYGKNHFWHHYQKAGSGVSTSALTGDDGGETATLTGAYNGILPASYEITGDGDVVRVYKDGNLIYSANITAAPFSHVIDGFTFDISMDDVVFDMVWNVDFDPDWIIKYKVEFQGVYNGEPFTFNQTMKIVSNDYESNTAIFDWSTPLQIFTFDTADNGLPLIGGFPSTLGYANTKVKAHFIYDAGILPYTEEAALRGVIWLELFEAGGINDRLRASTTADLTPEAPFVVQTGNKGATISYDGSQAIIEAEIDFTKLPAGKTFKLYARIYNTTVA